MDYIEKAVKKTSNAEPVSLIHSDSRGADVRDISYTQTKVVQVSPLTLKKNRIINPKSHDDSITNSYKMIRTRVLQRMQQNDWNTLAITSPGPGEGKTTTAINLSIALSMSMDHTVLLVDMDFRRPNIHSCFGIQPTAGLSDYFINDTPLQDILISPGIERLVLLPQRSSGEISSEILASYRMSALIDELKTRYPQRIVIFDLPPVLAGDDVLAFSSSAEATLLVVEEGRSNSKDLARAADLLQNVNLIGSVLNKSTDTSQMKNGY